MKDPLLPSGQPRFRIAVPAKAIGLHRVGRARWQAREAGVDAKANTRRFQAAAILDRRAFNPPPSMRAWHFMQTFPKYWVHNLCATLKNIANQ
jgi:hypothetical protein